MGDDGAGDEVDETILICILDKPLFDDDGRYHRIFRPKCDETGTVFSDAIEIHTIELSKLTDADIARGDLLDRWSYFLRESATLDPENLPALLDLPVFHSAMETLLMVREDDESWLEYDAQRLWVLDQIEREKQHREEGLEEGMEKGREEGREEGRQEGLAEGLQKGQARGVQIGRILVLQQVLNLPVSSDEALERESDEALAALANELAERVRSRTGGN